MKQLTVAVIACCLTTSAYAADMPIFKAAPKPVSDWSGFYVGGAIGGKWSSDRWAMTSLEDPPVFAAHGFPDSSGKRAFQTSSARFGGFAGLNFQAASWVYGVELDFGYSSGSKTSVGFPGCTTACAPPPFIFTTSGGGDTTSVRDSWDASLRGRLGFLANPALLLYGTAGLALQQVEATGACGSSATSTYCFAGVAGLVAPPQINPGTASNKTTRLGWTLGGGAEWKLSQSWSARVEYRFSEFSARQNGFLFGASNIGTNNNYRYTLETQTHLATLGLAYKF